MAKNLTLGLGLSVLMSTFCYSPPSAVAAELNDTQLLLVETIAQSVADNVPCDEDGADISKILKREAKKALKAFADGGKYVGLSRKALSTAIAEANLDYADFCLGGEDKEDEF